MLCPNCSNRFNYPAHRTLYHEQQGAIIKRREISFCSPQCAREWIKDMKQRDSSTNKETK